MILLIDNTKNLEQAKMTPKIIDIIDKLGMEYIIISKKEELIDLITRDYSFIKGVILSGGPICLSEGCNYKDISKNILTVTLFKNIPILGICFGYQIISNMFGGIISSLKYRHTGLEEIEINTASSLITNRHLKVFFSHQDFVSNYPTEFNIIKRKNGDIVGIESEKNKIFGYQFHPEGSEDGKKIIITFLKKYCK
jgi:GMP synthase (glutamine-hydrolysing)